MKENTYGADLKFLSGHTKIIELAGAKGARVAVAPGYQARIMTSTFGGKGGPSFGWINRAFIESGKDDPKFNNYGGEDRFWLGPEAGQFGLWFKPGDEFTMNHFKTPEGFNSGPFRVVSRGKGAVAMARRFPVTNYSGTTFQCAVERTVRLIDLDQASAIFGVPLPKGLSFVGFESVNRLKNAGKNAWNKETGLLSIWILGMFQPLFRGMVLAPFILGDDAFRGPKVNSYFGEIPQERCWIEADHVCFACDGRFRSKIGISPARARSVIGSWDPSGPALTVVHFNKPPLAHRMLYVNSQWQIQENPFSGDVVNSYNDGVDPVTQGLLGPFYELETSSAAADLEPGQAITHIHRTFHLSGPVDLLNQVSRRVLGVDVKAI